MSRMQKIVSRLGLTSAAQSKKTYIILIYLFLVTGCGMNNALVAEMETTYNLPSTSSTESNKNVAITISKHFPKGMKILNALNELKKMIFQLEKACVMATGYGLMESLNNGLLKK